MITDNQFALLELVKNSLFGITPNLPEDIDYDEIFAEAQAQTITALVAPCVPKDLSFKWQEPSAQSMAHYMRSLFEQTNLVKLFDNSNIPLVILKGTSAAVYYPKPQLRLMGDIDFLVPEDDYDKAFSLLENNGYTPDCDHEEGRDFTFTKGGVMFELHKRYSDEKYDIEDILIDGMKRSVQKTISGQTFPSLPDYENGLVLLDHIRHHLYAGLGLRQIIDWTMFANCVLSNENYEKNFLPLIKSAGLETFCKVVTKMCKTYIYLPESVTWCNDADMESSDQLLELVMSSGNFGIKNPCEYTPALCVTTSIRKNGFFKTLQTAGVNNFEICKKNKFFRAFAWLFQLFRYIKRGAVSLFKKEKPIKDISTANKKADFDNRLGL